MLAFAPSSAACGGFFCSQVQPVNQAAERIIFADNGDGTQTAVIEILYEGPSESFSWLLPISSVPAGNELGVASSIAFQRLQSATNPQYTLTRRVEGECKPGDPSSGSGGGSGAGGDSGSAEGGEGPTGGVVVEASGVVGAFEWTVISLDDGLPNPADVAVAWLGDNGYDVPSGAPALLGPYLQDGLYLLALRLTKGADVGSIRPISLTYAATRPMIPVKLTAVAANENMGVMAWVLGASRAVPQNYLALELNEARINWFNPASNYDAVVTAAADDAQGQGFVTELAAPTSTLAEVVWSAGSAWSWDLLQNDDSSLLWDSYYAFGAFDGYWDVVRTTATLPADVTLDELKGCPYCYFDDITVDRPAFLAAFEEQVIEPVRSVQALIDAHPHVTRLYTTMSAEEMTLDPLFTFNPDLADVSNVHNAERIIECNPSIYESEAAWRIELPQGGIVRGTADDASSQIWPTALDALPPNRLIERLGETGQGKVVEDNSAEIDGLLDAYNETVPVPVGTGGDAGTGGAGGTGGTGGTSKGGTGGTGGTGKGGSGGKGGTVATGGTSTDGSAGDDGTDAAGGALDAPRPAIRRRALSSGGCAITPGVSSDGLLFGSLGLLLLAGRRRRRG
jgi:hypothetical protein